MANPGTVRRFTPPTGGLIAGPRLRCDSLSNGLTLRLTRTIPAPRPAVWEAMTDPGLLARWWGPQGFSCPSVDFEPQVGDRYRIAMQPPEGEPFHLEGEFREVERPARLSYTFIWEPPDPDDRETVVSISLEDCGESTEVSLTQRDFATEGRRALHDEGWNEALDRLGALLS
jgi:uncharacterized protein YndB with AHSA1/START domain